MTQILLIARTGGSPDHVEHTSSLVVALKERGHGVDVLAPHLPGDPAPSRPAVAVELPERPRLVTRGYDDSLRLRTLSALREASLPRPDVVVVTSVDESMVLARHLSVHHDLPVALALDGPWGEGRSGRVEELLAQSVHTADALVASSVEEAGLLRHRFTVPSVEVLPVASPEARVEAVLAATEFALTRERARRMAYHAPYPLDPAPRSASRQRPNQMLAAFTELGYRVHRLTGHPFQRSLALADLRRRLAAGQKVEFLYSENSTQPNVLASSVRRGVAPLLEARMFALCALRRVPVGQFYRDVYWRFKESQASVPLPRRAFMQLAYRVDLAVLRASTAHMFLPSLPMAPIVPFPERRVSALPPGAPVHDSSSPSGVELLYVGGIGSGYALDEGLKALKEVPEAHLTMVVRPEEWQAQRERYAPLLTERVTIVHAGSDELQQHYDAASACLLLVAPDGYRRFAVPLKLFEYLGYGKPVLASRGTLAGDMVAEMGSGFTVENEAHDIAALLRRLAAEPALLKDAGERARAAGRRNTWSQRARTVAEVLTGRRDA